MQKLSVGTSPEYLNETPVVTPAETAVPATPASTPTMVSPEPSVTPPQKGTPVMKKSMSMLSYVVIGVAIGAGVFTGLGAARLSAKSGSALTGGPQPIAQIAGDSVKNGDVFGTVDAKTFKDTGEGYLEIGGHTGGEGTHKLLRAGGISQTIYLTSSITDLDKFQGMEVRVSGETNKAQTAGWLMDVGRVEVINTQGTAPTEE